MNSGNPPVDCWRRCDCCVHVVKRLWVIAKTAVQIVKAVRKNAIVGDVFSGEFAVADGNLY